jgi:hypothetical protein
MGEPAPKGQSCSNQASFKTQQTAAAAAAAAEEEEEEEVLSWVTDSVALLANGSDCRTAWLESIELIMQGCHNTTLTCRQGT